MFALKRSFFKLTIYLAGTVCLVQQHYILGYSEMLLNLYFKTNRNTRMDNLVQQEHIDICVTLTSQKDHEEVCEFWRCSYIRYTISMTALGSVGT